jgi:hypothetical protein
MSEWYEQPYPRARTPVKAPWVRELYSPDAAAKGKVPSPPGPDVKAIKRALSRGGRLAWTQFDDAYYNVVAHGKEGGNVGVSGMAGFQRQAMLVPTGWLTKTTFAVIKSSLIPNGLIHAGEPLLDRAAVELLEDAAKLFAERPAAVKIREAIADFCERAERNENAWHYSQNRPVKVDVDPSHPSVTSDCSGYCIQAYHYAKRMTGLPIPDPAKQGFSGYGNTDLYLNDHQQVGNGRYEVGDLAHYRGHVTICRKAGTADTAIFSSHGQEAGPYPVGLYYRSGLREVVRPPLGV